MSWRIPPWPDLEPDGRNAPVRNLRGGAGNGLSESCLNGMLRYNQAIRRNCACSLLDMAVKDLKETMPVARISRAMEIPRSTIYYRHVKSSGYRKSRIRENIETRIKNIAEERTTYGYRRIWAMLRNSGTNVNIKTVRRILRRNNLALPYAKHITHTRTRDLTKPDQINRLWETDIHYVSSVRDGMTYLMSVKDCFSKRWISYEYSRTCTAADAIRAVEKAFAIRFQETVPQNLVLRTDNGPQYVSREFNNTLKILGIKHEYIKNHTPEDNGDIESFHNSLKTDYIWVTDVETFEDGKKLMEYAFNDYNTVRPHSSIGYLSPEEFERRCAEDDNYRKKFLEDRKKKEERRMKNRIEKRRRLKENVS
ncbi:MAG: IS3 family transposase [Cuniculiplasma sp.]